MKWDSIRIEINLNQEAKLLNVILVISLTIISILMQIIETKLVKK